MDNQSVQNTQVQKTTICLSMIVKNEAHIILKTLTQLISIFNITYIIISDTGSTDNTIEVINKFLQNKKVKDKNINGEVHKNEWVDFSHNRNIALDLARPKADYSLIFDADDIVHGENLKLPDILEYDSYYFKIDINKTYYRPLLVKNTIKFKWYGVLHEFLYSK